MRGLCVAGFRLRPLSRSRYGELAGRCFLGWASVGLAGPANDAGPSRSNTAGKMSLVLLVDWDSVRFLSSPAYQCDKNRSQGLKGGRKTFSRRRRG